MDVRDIRVPASMYIGLRIPGDVRVNFDKSRNCRVDGTFEMTVYSVRDFFFDGHDVAEALKDRMNTE